MQISTLDSTIIVSDKLEQSINHVIIKCKSDQLYITVDENTKKHCLPLVQNFKCLKDAIIIETLSGEDNKSIEAMTQIWNSLCKNGADRNTLLINLGGGLLCDMGGFAASTFKRGITFVNIPTTLLAQVDASIGGKLAINFNKLKNEIGLFKSPKFVIIETRFLKTLDNENLLSGYAEIIKHALISSPTYWETIKEFDIIVDIDNDKHLKSMITKSLFIKNDFVKSDPREKNIRKALNFGHTIGHAIESYMIIKNTPISHGAAVAAGMVCESYLSHKYFSFPLNILDEIAEYIIENYNVIPFSESAHSELYALMKHDKKNENKNINFTLISKIGSAEINQNCKKEDIFDSLDFYRNLVSL